MVLQGEKPQRYEGERADLVKKVEIFMYRSGWRGTSKVVVPPPRYLQSLVSPSQPGEPLPLFSFLLIFVSQTILNPHLDTT